MSLEELKNDWNSLQGEATTRDILSREEINSMLKSKYRIRLVKKGLFELGFLLLHAYFAVLLVFRFDELGQSYLQVLGVATILILILLFVLRVLNLARIYKKSHWHLPHNELVKTLSTQQVRRQRFSLLYIVFGFLLTISLTVLTIKIYNEFDVTQTGVFWGVTIPMSIGFIVLFNKITCLLYTSPSPRDKRQSRMPSSA